MKNSSGFMCVKNNIRNNLDRLDNCEKSMKRSVDTKIALLRQVVQSYTKILENQSPLNNLKKGYGLIYKNNNAVRDYIFTAGESAEIVTLHQVLECEVKNVKPRKA